MPILLAIILCSCAARKQQATPVSPVVTPSKPVTAVHPVLGIPVPASANTSLVNTLEKWKGTPYRFGGNTSSGIDCSGLIHQLYKEAYQLVTPRTTADLFTQSSIIPVDSLQEGDLVFFTIGTSKPGHAGIYLWDQLFFHASTSKGVMVSSLQEAYWKKYFTAAGRLRKAPVLKP
ncbi:C40 family peptidase [Phnomibacter sp. MR]|uniref:C40 family peptidase n=1 Tax=Phnomibacter sp. MR TaxID=3042318 RepID=UPI003A7F86F2